jgi:WD40 repeat protein
MGCSGGKEAKDGKNSGAEGAGGAADFDSDDEDLYDMLKPRTVHEGGGIADDPDAGFVNSALNNTAVKPWQGTVDHTVPSSPPPNNATVPDEDLDLEWAYGYANDRGYNNIAVDSSGQVVYPTAAVVVRYDVSGHSQSFNLEHNDDVLCLATCETRPDLIGTGQTATLELKGSTRHHKKPHAVVWDTKSGTKIVIPDANEKATRACAFSRDGKYFACVGYDQKCTVNVYSLSDGAATKVFSESADNLPNKIHGITFGPDNNFVTVGVKHACYWTFTEGTWEKKRVAISQKGPRSAKKTKFYNVAFYNGDSTNFAMGCADGYIYLCSAAEGIQGKIGKQRKTIWCLKRVPGAAGSGYSFVSASKDGTVHTYEGEGFGSTDSSGEINISARALAFHNGSLHVGTNDGQIIKYNDHKSEAGKQVLVESHFDGELWALDVDPNDDTKFATAGEDNLLIIWDMKSHRLVTKQKFSSDDGRSRRRARASTLSSHPPGKCARSIAYSPDSTTLAVGRNDGKLSLFSNSSNELSESKVVDLNKRAKNPGSTENWIEGMNYSPDGKALAVCTHGGVTVLLDTSDYDMKEVLDKSTAANVTSCDWSQDGKFISTVDASYELLFYNITPELKGSSQETSAPLMKDVEWATQTNKLGWWVDGIWSVGMDGTDINSVARSPGSQSEAKLIASGDDWGRVNLYRNPVGTDNEAKHFDNGHSSFVCRVKFSRDGRYLLSAGGFDKTILQWRIR